MEDNISVDVAIEKAKKTILYPSMGILIGIPIILCILAEFDILQTWFVLIGFICSTLLSILFWSFTITDWKIWAYENVRNLHELKRRAIQEKLTYEDDSFYLKLEFKTRRQKEKLKYLTKRFENKDLFIDDNEIPTETIISFSKNGPSLIMYSGLGSLALISFTLSILFNIYGIILCIILLLLTYLFVKHKIKSEWQITLNENGIETANTNFYEWNKIKNEIVIEEGSSKYREYYLTYEHPTGFEKLRIDITEISNIRLEKLMRIYRGRFENKINYR